MAGGVGLRCGCGWGDGRVGGLMSEVGGLLGGLMVRGFSGCFHDMAFTCGRHSLGWSSLGTEDTGRSGEVGKLA